MGLKLSAFRAKEDLHSDRKGVSMSTQKLFKSESVEPGEKKPLQRTQKFLKELKITFGLVKELFEGVDFVKLELYFYRTFILVHLIKFLWGTVWH